jgi:hypothetical protein
VAQTLTNCDLILVVCYGSGGWRLTRARGRRWFAGAISRGGASPALADLGRLGLVLDKVWPGRKLAACVTHLGGWHGSAAAVAVRAAAGAGRCGGACQRARVRAARGSEHLRTGAMCMHGAKTSREQGMHGSAGARHSDLRFCAAAGHWRAAVRPLWGTKGHNT